MRNQYAGVLGLSVALASGVVMANPSDELTVYGRANVSLQSNDDGSGAETDVVSNSSRFGLKGHKQLQSDLEVFYQIELGVDLADSDDNKDAVTNRNQIVGLRGNFGEVMLGRYDTVLKDSQGKVDQFADFEADLKSLFRGENRPDSTVTYYSPSFAHFKVGVTYVASENDEQDDGFSFGLLYGDSKLKKTAYYAALAFDRDVNGYDITQVSGATKLGNTQLGLALQSFETVDGLNDSDGYLISVAHPYQNWVFKAQYQALDDGNDTDASLSVGTDYFFSSDTRVYAWYTGRECDISNYATRGCGATPGVEQDYIALGIRHDFSW